jgi:opacity protein-like surface antigen
MRSLLLISLLLGASVAQADDGLFYVGAGVTETVVNTVKTDIFWASPNINSTSWDVYAGIRPISLFAVEADYFALVPNKRSSAYFFMPGTSDFYEADAKAFAGYAVGFLPIPVPNLDVYGKVGVARYELSGSATLNYFSATFPGGFYSSSDNSTALTWGAGLQGHLGVFGGRLEYTGFSKANTNVFSLSVFVNF